MRTWQGVKHLLSNDCGVYTSFTSATLHGPNCLVGAHRHCERELARVLGFTVPCGETCVSLPSRASAEQPQVNIYVGVWTVEA